MDFAAFLTALGLVFVIEGIAPFLSPSAMRRLYRTASEIPDKQLRLIGLAGMLAGAAVISLVR